MRQPTMVPFDLTRAAAIRRPMRLPEARERLGDRPLIVLTAGQYWKPDDPVAAKEIAEFHEVWVNQLQPELARLSTNGRQIVVENSDHGIPEQAPASIVGAVHEIVTDVRNRQGH